MNLYFIALVPPPALRGEIKAFKDEMHLNYDVKHALKSPAHITLQMPFKRNAEEETGIIRCLEHFSLGQQSFFIELSGFGCFSNRVIFINITDFTSIRKLHSELNKTLVDDLGFAQNEINIELHPHITIATRDLDSSTFVKAWSDFKNRGFKASFDAKSLVLLKHNGKCWDIYKEFLFADDL
jgi:2'-5' RNA ligase